MQQVIEKLETSQQEVIAFLLNPQSYGYNNVPVTRIDTHISVVFLVGDRAYKMKRAVRYAYLDYSTIGCRKNFCEAEVSLNRRTAPMLYRDIVPVTRENDGSLQLGGRGEPVEWLVEMARFDQSALFDRMAMDGHLTANLLTRLADEIAAFHASAEPVTGVMASDTMRSIVRGNDFEFIERVPATFDFERVERLKYQTYRALDDSTTLLDARARRGFVRRCHGDLHLRNICLIDGRPVLFDGIEFSDAFSVIDVLYDLAFLLMDLEHRGHRDDANLVFNRYMAMSGDLDGLEAIPLFLSCRAAVRAKTTAAAADAQADPETVNRLNLEARDYLDLACDVLEPQPPSLIAIGGLSGSGKSSLAQVLAPLIGRAPGAVILRSDVTRKRLFGVAPETSLDASAYTTLQSERVYRHQLESAAAALAAGHSAIVDAVFARGEERAAIEAVAQGAGARAHCLWLDAPAETLQARVTGRTCDASDADAEVVRQQLTYDLGEMDWQRVPAGGGPGQTLSIARGIVGA